MLTVEMRESYRGGIGEIIAINRVSEDVKVESHGKFREELAK